jgi:lauroyl/myristoyl acyltransferase
MRKNKAHLISLTHVRGRAVLKIAIAIIFASLMGLSAPEVHAQASQGFPDARMRDFERQRACEQNLPTCLPQIRQQMEKRRENQMWMSAMIIGVLVIIGLLIVRAHNKKKLEDKQMLARSRQTARGRKSKDSSSNGDDPFDTGPRRSKLERPPGFGGR